MTIVFVNAFYIYTNLILYLELRLLVILDSILLSNISENLSTSVQIVDSIQVSWGFRDPVKGNRCDDIQHDSEVHQVESVRANYCQIEYPDDLTEAFRDHDNGTNCSLLLRRNMLHEQEEAARHASNDARSSHECPNVDQDE